MYAATLVDTKVWLDCIDETSPWHDWAVEQLQFHSERSPLHVNLIIYTELLVPGPSVPALDALLDVYETLRTPLPWVCGSSKPLSNTSSGTLPRRGSRIFSSSSLRNPEEASSELSK